MDHNDFDFYEDFIEPIKEFLNQTHIKLDQPVGNTVHFMDEYYFPPEQIVNYEKKLIKSSIIWEIIEQRKKEQSKLDKKIPITEKMRKK